ncbi:hypothetical protein ACQP2H_13860 [Micromonospora sp. CA-248260]|uniref:hypothetical protein n=1 Tax=Micromonospora sp. CA-248260 TaxID=3239962 RepID=UPI003D8C9EC9
MSTSPTAGPAVSSAGVGVWCRCGGHGPSSSSTTRRFPPRRSSITATAAKKTASSPAVPRISSGLSGPAATGPSGGRATARVPACAGVVAGRGAADVVVRGGGLGRTGVEGGALGPGGRGAGGPSCGSRPIRTPWPFASRGNTSCQPGRRTTPSVNVSPSGWARPAFSSTISRNRLPLPRVRSAMA